MQTAAIHIDYRTLYEQAAEQVGAQQIQIAALRHELDNLKKMIFGSRTEKFVPAGQNTSQLALDIQAEQSAQRNITAVQKIAYTRIKTEVKQNHPGRHKLPEHLERREQIIEPAEDTNGLKRIGEEVTEELDFEPGKLFVNRYVRPKYAKPNNAGVLIAPMIDRPFAKSIAGPGLPAQVIISKYVDHTPLHRQNEQFKREGISIPSSTFADMVTDACNLITPLYGASKKIILQSSYLHADETPIKVLDRDKKGTTHRGYYWVYHNSIERLVLFDYRTGRGQEGPLEILKDFKGHLQTDGYVVYDVFKNKDDVTVMHCMAHARRMFYESQDSDKERAEYALAQIGKLYAIERKATGLSLDQTGRLELRREQAVPILNQLGVWMKEQYLMVLPKSPIGKALGYSIQRWNELMVYASDGKLNIDNNPVENSIRPVAIGRKNYLFAGSHEAAQRSAMLYSLLGTAKLHDINPFIWLRDILQRIGNHPINRIEELLPQNWQPVNTGL
jgi:transposase